MLSRRLHLDGGGIIAVGTRVSSQYIVFDAPSLMSATGSILFSGPVLGLASARGVLARTDFLGVPGVDYQKPDITRNRTSHRLGQL